MQFVFGISILLSSQRVIKYSRRNIGPCVIIYSSNIVFKTALDICIRVNLVVIADRAEMYVGKEAPAIDLQGNSWKVNKHTRNPPQFGQPCKTSL
jgi:hypothetical protein